jgi:hypothetical protein
MTKKAVTMGLLLMLAGIALQAQLQKQRLFKVDPASVLFKELRVAVEHRLIKDKDYFWYLAPYGYHHFWRSKANPGFDRPDFPQKYYGLGIRAGARRYFFPKKSSPHGFFVQAHTGMRHIWVNNYNDNLIIDSKFQYTQFCIGGTVGYQWITGPRKDFTYGFIGGFEQFFFMKPLSTKGLDNKMVTRSWYEFPFIGHGYTGFRLYLGIEVGFAFLQRDLHW